LLSDERRGRLAVKGEGIAMLELNTMLELNLDDALQKVLDGEIKGGNTIMLLQFAKPIFFQVNRK
jgi:hypothetical protein